MHSPIGIVVQHGPYGAVIHFLDSHMGSLGLTPHVWVFLMVNVELVQITYMLLDQWNNLSLIVKKPFQGHEARPVLRTYH